MPEITQGNQPVLPYPGRAASQVIETRVREGVMMFPSLHPSLRLRRGIVCQQAVELVTGYLEGTLARAGRRRFEAHLADCPHCPEYLAQMRKTIELTGSLTPDDLTPQMQDEFIAIYRQWRAGQDG